MGIDIFGLDAEYEVICKAMDGKIYHHDGVIDVKFPNTVSLDMMGNVIKIRDLAAGVGMDVHFDEFFSITIS